MENLANLFDPIIKELMESEEYKELEHFKKELEKDAYLEDLITTVKEMQQEEVKTGKKVEALLDLKEELNKHPLYMEYTRSLTAFNEKLMLYEEIIQNYFDNLQI